MMRRVYRAVRHQFQRADVTACAGPFGVPWVGKKRYKEVMTDQLITVQTLEPLVGTDRVIVIDAREEEAYEDGHIPGAINIHPSELECVETLACGTDVPHQLRPPLEVAAVLSAAGVTSGTRVCIYDEGGGFLAARLWWILDVVGHSRAQLLDGGYFCWATETAAIEDGFTSAAPAEFVPSPHGDRRVGFADVITAIGRPDVMLCNSLPYDAFLDETIPGSVSFPYTETFAEESYPLMRTRHELAAGFAEQGITQRTHLICFCGIGYSASQLYFAARYSGMHRVALYDGSMVDWSAHGGQLVPGQL